MEKTKTKQKNSSLDSLLLPHDLNAEMAVLSAIFIDSSFALSEIAPVITEEDFYKESHREIFRAIMDIKANNGPIDTVSVGSKLQSQNKLEFVGGYSYLSNIETFAPSSQNVEYYAKIIRGKSQLRNLIKFSHDIESMAMTQENEVGQIIDSIEKMIFEISQNRETGESILIKDLTRQTIEFIEERFKNPNSLIGLPSGFKSLDNMTNGFQNSDLIILAARPSMGKTALALNIAANIGIPKSYNIDNFKSPSVLIFSLEMSEDQLMQRLLTSEARVDIGMIKKGTPNSSAWQKLLDAVNRIQHSEIRISEASGLSYLDMRTVARRLKAKNKLDLIIVDYLQLIQLPRRSDPSNRQNEVAEISRNLKFMARELNVPVIALSQLSRDVEKRADKAPILSDLRDSGAIEQDADIVAFIHRPGYYDKNIEDPMQKNKAEIIIAKHRNGPVGKVELTFIENYTRFEETAHSDF
jgi:replicative DNA helicase